MHTQNVNVKVAGEETAGRWGKKPLSYTLLVAENETGSADESDVMEFSSLAALKKMRRRSPEKMKGRYAYVLSSGVDSQFRHISVVEADHFKQFVHLIEREGIDI